MPISVPAARRLAAAGKRDASVRRERKHGDDGAGARESGRACVGTDGAEARAASPDSMASTDRCTHATSAIQGFPPLPAHARAIFRAAALTHRRPTRLATPCSDSPDERPRSPRRRDHGQPQRPARHVARRGAARRARHPARGARRLRAPHAGLDVRVCAHRRIARARGDHRRRRRRGAPARHGRRAHHASRARRADPRHAAQRRGRAARPSCRCRKGVPVGTLAIGEPGAANAALLAAAILAGSRTRSCASGSAPGAPSAPPPCWPTRIVSAPRADAHPAARHHRHPRRRTARTDDRARRARAWAIGVARARPRRRLRRRGRWWTASSPRAFDDAAAAEELARGMRRRDAGDRADRTRRARGGGAPCARAARAPRSSRIVQDRARQKEWLADAAAFPSGRTPRRTGATTLAAAAGAHRARRCS